MDKVYDYIVIGSGFGGSVASLRLAEKGYSVLTLEKGKRYLPDDFPKTNWNLRKYLWLPALRFFGIQKLSFYREASILSGVGVGGGSLVYANTLFYPPDEFFNHASWKNMGKWKSVLRPYYETAAFMLGRTKFSSNHIEDQFLYRVAKKMGREDTYDTVQVGVYLNESEEEKDPYFQGKGPLRKPCIECAGCMIGCRENAKNSLDKNYLYFAEKLGVEIMPETHAIKIQCHRGEYSVATRSSTSFINRKRKTFRSRGLIIAGGTLGSLELLLKQKYKYKTLPGLSEKLGYSLITNSETLNAVSFIPEKTTNGLAISSVFNPDANTHVEVVKYPVGSGALRWFFSLSAKGAKTSIGRILNLLSQIIIHPVNFLKILFKPGWSSNLVIFLVMQHIENAMRMVWRKGIFGGRMIIYNKERQRVPAFIKIGQQAMENYAKESLGIPQNIILEILFNRSTTAHILGGCPMSENIAKGVVDPNLKVHGYQNMYIMDGSVIQGNIGVNPSFSILAMAEYAMDKIPLKKESQKETLESMLSGSLRQAL
jgi:cholesterol oxidase